MEGKVRLFLENLKKIDLFFGAGARQTGGRVAVKLAAKGMSFSAKEYEEIVDTIKANTKWYQKIRTNKQLQQLYYTQFAGQPQKVEQALIYQKSMKAGGEGSYRAAMYIKEEGQISKIKDVLEALKKKPGMKWSSVSYASLAMLAGRPESAEELAMAYWHYYGRLADLSWKSDRKGKVAAILLTIATGDFNQSIWERVGLLSKLVMEEYGPNLYFYEIVCLLALAQIEPEALPGLYEMHNVIMEETDGRPLGNAALLLAAQLYTSDASFAGLFPDGQSFDVDYLDFAMSVIDGVFDGDGGNGGDGSGDGGGGGGE